MLKVKITEENYTHILDKIMRTTNAYKCFSFYKVLDEHFKNTKENKQYNNSSIGFVSQVVRDNSEIGYKRKRVFYATNTFILPSEHYCKTEYSEGLTTYEAKLFEKYKPLVHLDVSTGCAVVLHEGDYIVFLPFGAFKIYQRDTFELDSMPKWYSYTYIPDIFRGKIRDLSAEKSKRHAEWVEEAESWEENLIGSFDDDELEDY